MGIYYGKADFITYGKPSLFLDFANKKSLTDRITGSNLITFTRTSSATYVGSDGLIKSAAVDEPRFDHNPVTGESLGLLIEEQRSKISDTIGFPLGSLSATGSTDIISPDGTTSGITKITSPSFGSTSGLQQRSIDSSYFIHSVTANQYYTSSIYVYATGVTNSSRTVSLGIVGGGCLDAAGGPVLNSCGYIDGSDVVSSNTSFDVVLPRNKWVKVFLNWRSGCTSSAGRSAAQVRLLYSITNNQTDTNFINSTGSPVMYLWGMTVETSGSTSLVSFPTSYIYGSSATRTLDNVSITGTNFSSWFNTNQGTFVTEYKSSYPAGNERIINFGGGPTSTIISNEGVIGSGLYFSSIGNISGSAADGVKVAATTSVSESAGSFDGNTAVSTGACSYYAGSTSLNFVPPTAPVGQNWIKKLSYYPSRLTNTQLQNLTR